MKRDISLMMAVLLVLTAVFVCPTAAFAESELSPVGIEEEITASGDGSGTTGDCTWTLKNDTLTISGNGKMADYSTTEYKPWGNYTKIVIEKGVTYIGDYAFYNNYATEVSIADTVRSIGNHAFEGSNYLESITLPDSVEYLDTSVFNRCSSLKRVKLSSSLKWISNYCFAHCTSLTDVDFSSSVTDILWNSFLDCTSLEKVNIPASVTRLDDRAFDECHALSEINVDHSNTTYASVDGVVFTKDMKKLYLCPNARTSVTLPDSVDSFDYSGIFCAEGLTEISVGATHPLYRCYDGVLYSKDGTRLINCPRGKNSVEFLSTVTEVADHGFYYCHKLTSVSVPQSVAVMGKEVFCGCKALQTATLSDSITELGDYFFAETSALKSIDLPKSLTSIGARAFSHSGIKSLIVHTSLTKIDAYAFRNSYLSDIYYYGSEDDWNRVSIDETGNDAVLKAVMHYNYNAGESGKSISSCTITLSQTSYVYDGTEKRPTVTVKDGSKILTQNTDYTLSYANNRNAGTATVTITGIGSYEGSTVKAFTITQPVQKKNITSCTVTLSHSSYIYDGTEKTPTVTVRDGSEILTQNTDYTVSYRNNKNEGTATAEVTGIGNYTGSASKNFLIIKPAEKTDISACSVTLSQASYAYDGYAKTPSVTVKDGSLTLIQNTDYTVSYNNNVNVGTATVTISGIGDYIGLTKKTFVILSAEKEAFVWGVDNWNFNNSASQGYFGSSTYRKQISSSYLDVLKKNLTNSEYQVIFSGTWYSGAWLDDTWGGSCYGMSSTSLLSKNGLLPFSDFQSGAKRLSDLSRPTSNSEVSSLITYYQMLQVKSVIQQQYRTIPYRSNEENIKDIVSQLDAEKLVLLGFQKTGWGGHAILATGYEYGSWTWNGVSYQGCINICDPNASIGYNNRYNIYFNTNSYNWTIPAYAGITSASGAVFNYIGAEIADINAGGYLSGTTGSQAERFVARIDAAAIADNRSVSKVTQSNGGYVTKNSAPGDIVEDYSYIAAGESEGMIGYNLYDADASYRVTQETAQELQLSMDYEDCNLGGGSKAGRSVIFDRSGYVQVNGESADFVITMTFDEDYPTDWFTIQAAGSGVDVASLKKVSDGFILSSDNLSQGRLSVNNRFETLTASFSTGYDSVFIYETDMGEIGVRVDQNADGVYETDLSVQQDAEIPLGDVDRDSVVSVLDATRIQKFIAKLCNIDGEAYDAAPLTETQKRIADVDADGVVSVLDATRIQKYKAKLCNLDGTTPYRD